MIRPVDLTAPFLLPERIARSLIEELTALRRSLDRVGEAAESVERMEAVANQALPVAERGIEVMERLIETIDRAGEQVEPMITSMDSAQAKVDPLIVTLEATLPALEQAIAMSKPLEGSVERLGRVLDKLPGGRAPRGDLEAAGGSEPG
jgi:hypothetical protein